MVKVISLVLVVMTFLAAHAVLGEDGKKQKPSKKKDEAVSFKEDIFPIIQKQCLPCHAEDNFNPSELSMDSYELLETGGKNGQPFVAGESKESLIIKKLGEEPPFGDRMPLNPKKKIKQGKAKWLSDEEVRSITKWIDQGAKDN
ncbi:MAG: hypothetical protein O7D34_01150 [Ignavibacteria bacterium]|nr:hypothetical protein [Ignavibacteria bacterium]